jgi:hypothetical protein
MLAPRPRIAALGAAARQRPRDVGVVFEVDERAREAARDFAPLFEAADTVAHGRHGLLYRPSWHGRGGTQRHIWALR